MKNENDFEKIISINEMYTLLELVSKNKDFKKFRNQLEIIIDSKNKRRKMFEYIINESHVLNRKYKNFIIENKEIIDILNEYDCLEFVVPLITSDGNVIEDRRLNYFYEYLLNNKDNLFLIKQVMDKINNLGLKYICLSDIDFKEYNFFYTINESHIFNWLENMEVLKDCYSYPIEYKTNDSVYCMKIVFNQGYQINSDESSILLNSFVFNPMRLPNYICKENTIDTLTKQIIEKRNNNVELIQKVYDKFLCLNENAKDNKNKEELNETLRELEEYLRLLKENVDITYNRIEYPNKKLTKTLL